MLTIIRYVEQDDGTTLRTEHIPVPCACGGATGRSIDRCAMDVDETLVILRFRHQLNEAVRVASSQLEPLTPDEIGERGKQMLEQVKDHMLRAEDYISMATWVRDGKPK